MRQNQAWKLGLLLVFIEALGFGEKCAAFSVKETSTSTASLSRRSFFTAAGTGAMSVLTVPTVAQAGIDPAMLKSLPVQGDESGSSQRLRQIEAIQRPSSDLVDIPFEELPSGVSFREYRAGKGDAGKWSVPSHCHVQSNLHQYHFFLHLSLLSPRSFYNQ